MSHEHRIHMSELTWPEYKMRIDAGAPIILPVGSTEQHGPHLPLGTDALLALGISKLVAQEIQGVVAPPVLYGYKSHVRTGGGDYFTGTTNLTGATFTTLLTEVLQEFLRHSAKRILIINTHYENEWFAREACHLVAPQAATNGTRIVLLSPWDVSDREVVAGIYSGDEPLDPNLQHAGWIETAMALYLFPELVRTESYPASGRASFPSYDVFPSDFAGVPPSGALSEVGPVSRVSGHALVEHRVQRIVEVARHEFDLQSGFDQTI